MTITAAIVLFAVIWFMVFLMILTLRLKTQGELGEIEPGTHASAPENPDIRRKAKITTIITVILWSIIAGIIVSGTVSVRDFDWAGVMDEHPVGDQ